jgi:hypothetical protein
MVTIMREPPLTNQRRMKTMKRKPWTIPPFQLQATTPPIPVFEHEEENIQQTDHRQTLQTNHQNHDLLNQT